VERVPRARKPANVPVEQPVRFELVINLKTAQQIRLTASIRVLTLADKIIKSENAGTHRGRADVAVLTSFSRFAF
jgi:hypothetical protein